MFEQLLASGTEMMWIWLLPVIIWDAVWKGIGLWKSGYNRQLGWFIAIFIVNSMGILPIIYLAFFQRGQRRNQARTSVRKPKRRR
jgi:methionyl-tRNA synthetase